MHVKRCSISCPGFCIFVLPPCSTFLSSHIPLFFHPFFILLSLSFISYFALSPHLLYYCFVLSLFRISSLFSSDICSSYFSFYSPPCLVLQVNWISSLSKFSYPFSPVPPVFPITYFSHINATFHCHRPHYSTGMSSSVFLHAFISLL